MSPRLPSAAPPRPVLWGLGALVLAAHWWLLAGPLLPGSAPPASPAPPGQSQHNPALPEATVATRAPAPRPLPVAAISTVRWISPAPARPPAGADHIARPANTTPPPRAQREPVNPGPANAGASWAAAPTALAPAMAQPADGSPAAPASRDNMAWRADAPADPLTPRATEAPAASPTATSASEPATEPPAPLAADAATVPPKPLAPMLAVSAWSAPGGIEAQAPTAMAAAAPTVPGLPAASRAARASVPPSVDLFYNISGQAKGLRYSADAHLHWHVSGNRYEAEMTISAFLLGSRAQTSRGLLSATGLEPERFGDRRRGSEKAAHFDRVQQRIRFSNNAPDAPLQAGAQDRLSVLLQLAGLLNAQDQAYPDGSRLILQVAGTGGADLYTFEVGPLQTLTLPAGQVRARLLTREARHEHDNRLELWLAPERQHLPVRIRVTDADGAQADQQLRQWPPLPAPPARTP